MVRNKQGRKRASLSTVDCSLVHSSAVCGVGWGELWGLFNLDENSLFWLILITIPVTLALFRALAFHVTRVTADMMEKAKISRDYFLGSLLTSGGGAAQYAAANSAVKAQERRKQRKEENRFHLILTT